jgi:hypothetical protein
MLDITQCQTLKTENLNFYELFFQPRSGITASLPDCAHKKRLFKTF